MYKLIKFTEEGMVQSHQTCKSIEEAKKELNKAGKEFLEEYEEKDVHFSTDGMSVCVCITEDGKWDEVYECAFIMKIKD